MENINEEKEHPRQTKKQREWIFRRDNYECQFIILTGDEPRKCKSKKNLQIHHIVPVDWSYEVLKQTPEEVNRPENLITLCEYHHMKYIHPDYGIIARRNYFYDEESYKKVEQWHKALAQAGIPYWITIWDEIFKIIARIRTFKYLKEHPDDPYPKWEKEE